MVNPIRGPALPFLKQTQYQVLTQEGGGVQNRTGSQNLINMLKSRKRNSQSTIVSDKKGGSTMSINQGTAAPRKSIDQDDLVVFAPLEQALKEGQFFDPQGKSKIVNKPIVS